MNANSADSIKEPEYELFYREPMALSCTPTSFALFSDLAVVRLIKLMQAISKTSIPTILKMRTYSMKPAIGLPPSKLSYKCQFVASGSRMEHLLSSTCY